MSDEKKNIDFDALTASLKEKAELEKKREAVLRKRLTVEERRLDNDLARYAEHDQSEAIAKATGYNGPTPPSEAEKILKNNSDYILSARNRFQFINNQFDSIPLFPGNIILAGAQTGDGKSTTVANIARSIIGNKNRLTGRPGRVLILTNEETPEDIYNRITCLAMGWPYVRHSELTLEQHKIFNEYIKFYTSSGLVKIITDDFLGGSGTTTTLEGICRIFDDLIAKNDFPDVTLIDYFQNIDSSKERLWMNEYQVQAALANKLKRYRSTYHSPIVVFAQLKPQENENETVPFKVRLEGRKSIMNAATCVFEIVPNREELTTEFKIIKNRFEGESVGTIIEVGYHNGRFISEKDKDWPEYQEKLNRMRRARDSEAYDLAINPVETQEEKNDEKVPESKVSKSDSK